MLNHELFCKVYELLPPSVLYQKGKYVYFLIEFDGVVDHGYIDKRRHKRNVSRYYKTHSFRRPLMK